MSELSVLNMSMSGVLVDDLAQHAISSDGLQSWLGWCGVTHELFTYAVDPEDPSAPVTPLRVVGHVNSLEQAREVIRATAVALPEGGGAIHIALLEATLGLDR